MWGRPTPRRNLTFQLWPPSHPAQSLHPPQGASKTPSTRSSPSGYGRPTTQHKVLHSSGGRQANTFTITTGFGPPHHPAPRLHLLPGAAKTTALFLTYWGAAQPTSTTPSPFGGHRHTTRTKPHHSYWSRSPRGLPGPPTVRPPYTPVRSRAPPPPGGVNNPDP